MKATVKLRALVSIKFLAAATALATLGLAPGCASSEGEEDEERTGEKSQALCCIEYVCPTDGFDTMGCKGGVGQTTINSAFNACRNHCPASCISSGLLCDPLLSGLSRGVVWSGELQEQRPPLRLTPSPCSARGRHVTAPPPLAAEEQGPTG